MLSLWRDRNSLRTRPGHPILELFPTERKVDAALPERARGYLKQAIDSVHAPSGAIMLCASSVDAMLKEKGLTKGTLHSRINQAAAQHLITDDMAKWAHEVRLDANVERHSDLDQELPTADDAKRTLHFTEALGRFLFVLPALVAAGLREVEPATQKTRPESGAPPETIHNPRG